MPDNKMIFLINIGTGFTTNKFAIISFKILTTTGKEIEIFGKIHVVKKLACDILIGTNIFKLNGINI